MWSRKNVHTESRLKTESLKTERMRALRAGKARELRARKTLTPRFTDFFTDFEKKTDCFAILIGAKLQS